MTLTERFKARRRGFQLSMSASPVVSITCNSFKEHRGDVMTGVQRRCLKGQGCHCWQKRHDMLGDPSLSEAVKAGLGGHDAGVWVVDEGVEPPSLPI